MSEKKEEKTVELCIEELEERIAPGVVVVHSVGANVGNPTGGGHHHANHDFQNVGSPAGQSSVRLFSK